MEPVETGSHNSTRLSMYIRDMPLTPFGMSPTSERKKKKKSKTFNNTPGSNKLSRKNVKQTSSPRYDTSNKENEETPCRTRKYYTEDIKSSLPSITDQSNNRRESSRNSRSSKTSTISKPTTSSSHSKETSVERSSTTSVCPLSLQGSSESSHSTERRESVFTDIDDGSFIEFCSVPPKAPLYVPPKPPSSLYYSAESQNESEYSTSSKLSNAAVGFRKYVDAVKAKRALLDIVTEDVNEESDSGNKDKFLSDFSIVGGSADIVTKTDSKAKNAKEGALNSTMIPTAKQPFSLPDISTLTIESETCAKTNSNNSSPAVSPNYAKNLAQQDKTETITISESSEDESFMTANKSPPNEDEISAKNDENLNHEIQKNKKNLHIELEATCTSDMRQYDKHTSISESLISEDVSIVSSVAPVAKTKQFQSDATTVVYESVSVLKVPLRRSQRRSKENDEPSRDYVESEDTTKEFDEFRSKSPIYITEVCKPNITQRKKKKRNSKKRSESENQSNSSDTNLSSSRVNNHKISESDDISDDVLRSHSSNTGNKLGKSISPGSKHHIVQCERRKKSRSGKASVVSDTSEENYISKESLFVLKSGKKTNSEHSKEIITHTNQNTSNKAKFISNSDHESKSSLRKNKMVVEESDESSSDVPKKKVPTGKNITNIINESDEIRSDALPVPKNTPNKYVWKIENNIPKKVLMSDGEKKLKSPQVEQWIVKSPFKEGSFSSNFLFDSNTVTISDSPSQPNINKYNFKIKPSEISLKEKLDILDSKAITESMEKSRQIATPSRSINKKVSSPVETWVQTSPFKDSSLDSNFLLEEDNSYLSETPSQPKNCEEPNASSQSLKLRLSEGLDGSHSITASEKSKYTLGRIARSPKDASSQDLNTHAINGNQTMRKKSASRTNIRIMDSETNADDSDHSVRIKRSVRTSRSKVTVIDSETNGEESEDSIRIRRTPGTVLRVEESDSESEGANNSLKKVKKPSAKSKVKLNKKSSKSEIKKNKESRKGSKSAMGDDELKEIEKELNKIYNKDWHKNANAVLSSTKKQSKSTSDSRSKRSSRTKQKSYQEPETSDDSFINDEADEASDEELSVGEEEPQGSTLDSESEEETTRSKNSNVRDRVGSYISVEEDRRILDDTEQDGLDNYLAKRKTNKAESIEVREKENLDSYDSSFINDSDEDDEDDSLFVLPTLPKKRDNKGKPPWGSVASLLVSDEILNESSGKSKPKKAVKNEKNNGSVKKDKKNINEVKKGKKLWSDKKSPLTPLFNQKPSDKAKSSTWRNTPVTISSDEDDYELPEVDLKVVRPNAPIVPCWTPVDYKIPGIKAPPKTDLPKKTKAIRPAAPPGGATPTQSFLSSLSLNVNHGRCHPDAQIYVKNFKKNKESLAEKLYKYFNENAFDGKLPETMQIKWNARMTKTAGFCYYQIDKSKPSGRGARIELSSKVLDKPDRLRDTLIHEMCHAAAWIISAYKDGHGPLWKAWAAKAMIQFPELPPISRCHSYEISFKYTYKCTKCGYSIGRHSKSLDTNKKVCGYCFGKFEVFLTSKINKGSASASAENTPDSYTPGPRKTPSSNPFILFVKENYKTVKQSSGPNLKHGDVMKILSAEFSKMKASQ